MSPSSSHRECKGILPKHSPSPHAVSHRGNARHGLGLKFNMALDTEKKKSAPVSIADQARRDAALRGSAPAEALEMGTRHLYKPADFVVGGKDGTGIERCYTGSGASKVPTAPEIHGVPFDVIQRDGKGGQEDYDQVAVFLLSPTYVMAKGADGSLVEKHLNAGDIVLVTMTAALEDVGRAAQRGDAVPMWIRPIQKEPISGKPGQTTWVWSIKLGKVQSRESLGLPAREALPTELVS